MNKPLHICTIEERLGLIWRPWRKMDLIQMENNKFMVQLFHRGALEHNPWRIENNMLILMKVTVGGDLGSILMTKTYIWVQVHLLPFGFMDMSVGALVGNHVCRMVKYDDENNYDPCRKFMRVRGEIDMEETPETRFGE